MKPYDYIIVGAGSAGCVLANRLGAEPGHRILVLEAGGLDRAFNWKIHMPAGFAFALSDGDLNWTYYTEPEPFLDGRRLFCPRGRVVGGSSSINGSVYIRGHARDYDRWEQSGLAGWSYADVLPYFRRAERRDLGGDDYHGEDGPLRVSRGPMTQPLLRAWIDAGRQAGYSETTDLNGFQQEGLGPMDRTIHQGRRCSASKAYLHPAVGRGNVTVATRALTSRILFERKRAVGVEYMQGARLKTARAERGVIVSGGAINSPQILLLSGIGPADDLRKLDVPVIQDLPGVGQNLQDHIEVHVVHACQKPVTIYPVLKSRLRQLLAGIQWVALGTGPCASNQFEAGGFIRSRAGIEHPDLQLHFMSIAASFNGTLTQDGHCFQSHVGPLRPASRGFVRLKSRDPKQHPAIQFNYMQAEADRRDIRAGVRLTREIFAQKAFDPYRGAELVPGAVIDSDRDLDSFAREQALSGYHPAGTCKMGTDSDPMAVVSADAEVHGIEGLRVVDASIMPTIVSGNLNAPTIMMAEKISDRILGKTPLPKSGAKVFIAPEWETKQR